MSGSLTSLVLRDDEDEAMGHVRYTPLSGWLWACALCGAVNRPGAGAITPEGAVNSIVDHIDRAHTVAQVSGEAGTRQAPASPGSTDAGGES